MHDPQFWHRKRVLITGHTGFKGGWLALWLHRLGADVSGYALPPPTQPSLFETANVAGVVHTALGDVRDLHRLRESVADARPEVVIHMAAQPLVRRSYADPVETYGVNVMGTVNVLEAVRHCDSARAVIVVTSDKCYENQEWTWGYRESDPMGGHDPYSSSKGCAELVAAGYRRSFFSAGASPVGLATVRAGNVIGGGDWAEDRLIPDMIRSLASDAPVRLRNPSAVRPWQHVLEPLSGYLLLAERLWEAPALHSEGWNFGPREDAAVPVSRLTDEFLSFYDGRVSAEHDTRAAPHEAGYLTLDTSKARRRLGWQSQISLTTALEWTAEWYRMHREGADMSALSLAQIDRYERQTSAVGPDKRHPDDYHSHSP
jgi:CDP-glucose 4,6-dehydratase